MLQSAHSVNGLLALSGACALDKPTTEEAEHARRRVLRFEARGQRDFSSLLVSTSMKLLQLLRHDESKIIFKAQT